MGSVRERGSSEASYVLPSCSMVTHCKRGMSGSGIDENIEHCQYMLHNTIHTVMLITVMLITH